MRRMTTPRPQSTSTVAPPARTSVDGPARSGLGIGLPVPSKVTSTAANVGAVVPCRRVVRAVDDLIAMWLVGAVERASFPRQNDTEVCRYDGENSRLVVRKARPRATHASP